MERLAGRFGLSEVGATFWIWLRWPSVVVLLLLVVALISDLGPNVAQPFRYVTPGSVAAIEVERFGSYGATSGRLGGIVVLRCSFVIFGAVLLFGAEINATIRPVGHVPSDDAPPVSKSTDAR